MKLRHRRRLGWDEVNKKIAPQKLVIANLRQFIPYSSSEYVELVNRYLHKHLFCEEIRPRAAQLEKHTESV